MTRINLVDPNNVLRTNMKYTWKDYALAIAIGIILAVLAAWSLSS